MKDYVLLITLHADPALPPGYNEWGGTHAYMKELLDGYQEQGYSCILITRKSLRYLPNLEQYNDTCVIYRILAGQPEPMDKTKLKEYHDENVAQIKNIISAQESLPRIIHSVYWNSGRVAITLSQQIQIPFVHSVISNAKGRVARGAFEPVAERAAFEQEIFDKAKWLICVSEDEQSDLMRYYHIPKRKIIVAGQFIHPAFISPAHDYNNFPRINSHIDADEQNEIAQIYNKARYISAEDHYWAESKAFTYVGRMDFNKGIKYIFLAWYLLLNKYRDICPALWLIGGSLPEIESVRTQLKKDIPVLKKLEQQGKILWWGCLDPEGISTVLLKSSVLVTHSLYEPGGRVSIEAMSEGIPVIATPNGFAKEAIHDWREGFLVEHGNTYMLACRLEHFIRQPYLSNALGINAKEKARRTIAQWDFLGKHLISYGFNVDNSLSGATQPQIGSGRQRVDLFPYCNNMYSVDFLLDFFSKCINEIPITAESGSPAPHTSDILKIKSKSGNYILKRVYTRLAISPLFNPVGKYLYARKADKQYLIERNAYERQGSGILVGKDDVHYLLLLKELDEYQTLGRYKLAACLTFLVQRPNYLERQKADEFAKITNKPAKTVKQLTALILQLSDKFPDYYFEVSGVFSNQLCWRIAQHLITYNAHVLGDACKDLEKYASFFEKQTSKLNIEQLREINLDNQLKHFLVYNGKITPIDLEKTSIGSLEIDAAGLLYDYLLVTEDEFDFWPWVQTRISNNTHLNFKELLLNVAFRFFYEYIVRMVMRHNAPTICLRQVDYIYRWLCQE